MRPGDSCAKADGSGVQTYEQRARALEAAKPVIAIVGLLVAGFGACLIVTERRRAEAGQLEEA